MGIEEEYKYSSFRNVFYNWAFEKNSPLKDHFRLPEDYPEWNQFHGYQNLVDFEREAGALSGAILLFSEGSGALAELGAFCMDEILSERLLVVISRSHFREDSFLVHGPLKKLAGQHSDASICVVEANGPEEFYAEAAAVADALQEKINDNPRKELIRSERIRDQLLLLADLVELFGAAKETEIINLLAFFGVEFDRTAFRRVTNQLKLFNLVSEARQYEQTYFVAPVKDRESYMDYDAARPGERFDRTRFKAIAFENLKKDAKRKKAYEQIHGKVA